MKSRFLDLRNCHVLLPKGNGLRSLPRLEVCLREINESQGILHGSIEKLIRRNEITSNNYIGSKRLISSPIEIMQYTYIEKRLTNTQAVEKRFPGPALFHKNIKYENGMAHKITVPLQFLLKKWGDARNGYQCYVHTISHNMNNIKSFPELFIRNMSDSNNYYYVGITGRNWLLRLDEHIREMRQGNRRLFYRAWRERYGMSDVLYSSFLRNINLTYEEAMNWEEKNVDKIASDQYGLNMIPGGFKGLKYLHKLRITDREDITLEERDKAVAEYARRNPRKGLPNPFISELWKNDNYYLKIIEARPKTLSPNQVKKIRELYAKGWLVKDITEEVDALNELQVKNVIAKKTYKRIK